jgi:hypothetical protein
MPTWADGEEIVLIEALQVLGGHDALIVLEVPHGKSSIEQLWNVDQVFPVEFHFLYPCERHKPAPVARDREVVANAVSSPSKFMDHFPASQVEDSQRRIARNEYSFWSAINHKDALVARYRD